MTKSLSTKKIILIFGFPFSITLLSYFFIRSSWFQSNPQDFALGITLDLVITIPIIHYILIRKTKVPNFTSFSLFIIGILMAGVLIPQEHQSFLTLLKVWAVPVIEAGLISLIMYNLIATIREYRKTGREEPDFFNAIQQSTEQVLPGLFGKLLATEIATIYYALISWRARPIGENEFTYHKKSGTIIVISTLLFVLLIETFAVHILVHQWSATVAWVLTALSAYGCLQFIALMRSLSKRPTQIDKEQNLLIVRYGLFAQAKIPFADIESIEQTSRTPSEIKDLTKISGLDSHNIIIKLSHPQILNKIYGITDSFTSLAFFIDDKELFMKEISRFIHRK